MTDLERILHEQRAAVRNYEATACSGAALGIADWVAEEVALMREEKKESQ